MNTNMKELNRNEMEQANGGSIIGLICVLSLGGAIGLACGIGYAQKGSGKSSGTNYNAFH